jgi:predicted NAD/FAD-binding protein
MRAAAAMGSTGGSGTHGLDDRGPLDIAVVGTGISGMSCAWLLAQGHRVTVYESAERIGGHTNTVDVATGTGRVPIDTGFIVFNEVTYPNLTALFRHLGVKVQDSEMSFAVSLDDGRLEYAGTDARGLFAQPLNVLRPRFWGMLRDLLRFYRAAPADLARGTDDLGSLDDYLRDGGYGRALRDDHLLPMSAAIWSCPPSEAALQPAASFIRFCENHGLLKMSRRPVWRTVRGGSHEYMARLIGGYADRIRTNCPVLAVERVDTGVRVQTAETAHVYDHAVLACHADQALTLLGTEATAREQSILGAFRYTRNLAVLHTDDSFMPRRRAAWASWNYLGQSDESMAPSVTYWMNRLQRLEGSTQYFVTLNPPRPPRAGTLLRSEVYEHPVFDADAVRAQRQLWSLQDDGHVWFCGAHFGAGFHEDGLQAGLAVAEQLSGLRRPWNVANQSGRIHLEPKSRHQAQMAIGA